MNRLLESNFSELRLCLGSAFVGTFILNGEDLNAQNIQLDFDKMFELVHQTHSAKPFIFLRKRFIIIPIYCAANFDVKIKNIIMDVRHSKKYYSAIYPILFNSSNNSIELKIAAQNNTLLIYHKLQKLFDLGVAQAQDVCNKNL